MECLLKKACIRADTELCNENCMIRRIFYFLMETSNIPKNYWEDTTLFPYKDDVKTFETLAEIKDDIETFVEQGRFLYIHGDCGTSKTEWACKLMKQYLALKSIGNRFEEVALFIYVPTFTLKSKDFENREERDELLQSIISRKFVIIDDIGTITQSDYDVGVFHNVVNERYSRGLSTIFTGNIQPERLNRFLDNRVCDRILSDIVLEFKGKSRREYTNEYKPKENSL